MRIMVEERFWAKVAQGDPDACWPWTAAIFKKTGYGQFHYQGRPQGAHRVAWMLANGEELPSEIDVRHSCDNRPCCNPAHLSKGTREDNMQDAVQRGRMSRGAAHSVSFVPARGERNGNSRLTQAQVDEIRRRGGTISQRALAAEFGVSHRSIGKILIGQMWAPVKED
jgi:hypothetical protein